MISRIEKIAIIEEQLTNIAEFVKSELQNEIEQQGHKHTGKLSDSIEFEFDIDEVGQVVTIAFSWLKYGKYVDQGVSAANIPFSGYGKGKGKTSKYIQGLISWAKRKGFDKPKSAAFAIAYTHKQEGMSSKGSYKFSRNGRRKFFTSHAIDKSEEKVKEMIENGLIDALQVVFNNLLDNSIKTI